MIAKSTQSILVLGLAGSMVAAFAPLASAQTATTTSTNTSTNNSTQATGIQVTGGQATGTAAFFVPTTDAAGNVRLFDIGIQTLQIQTNRGTTTTSVFTPGAASFTDANNNGKPDSGDTGVLQGTLAGTAFTSNGLPIVFTGRETLLNFTLNNFSSQVNLAGSLISPKTLGAAPLVFLPAVNATLGSGSSFQSTRGDLQVGDFKAGLDNGLINLPPTLAFRSGDSSVPTVPIFDLGRRIKFKFEGDDAPGSLTLSSNALRFAGEANKKVEIQSVGSGDQKFEFKSDVGYVDVALGGIDNLSIQGAGASSSSFKYNIEGESNGILSLYNPGFLAFSGTARRDTKFKFESGSLKLEGRSSGPVDFYATAGLGTTVNRDTTFTNFNPQPTQSSNNSGACGVCGSSLVPGSTLNFGGTVITVGSPIILNSSSQQQSGSQVNVSGNFSGSASFGSSSSSSSGSIRFLAYAGSANTDLFALSGNSRVSRVQYRILSSGKRSDRVRVVNRGNQRYYVVNRGRGLALGRREQAGFAQLGPNCRIFPGLVGLRELSEDELAAVNANNTNNEDEGDDNSTSTNTGTSGGSSTSTGTSGGSSTNTGTSGGSSTSTGTSGGSSTNTGTSGGSSTSTGTSGGSSTNTNTTTPTGTEDNSTPTNTTTPTGTEDNSTPTNTTPSSTSDTNSSSNTSGSDTVDANAAPSNSEPSQSETTEGATETPAAISGLTTNPQ